ncbi:cell wall-binding repeat-containing protein [Clostridium sp. UBA4395]|uniref:cell wall-binding repeat-containing protein n=1 Tax=Clostridium sp. UBA4395 TaxID=1946360 RepID=UPI0032180BF1
MKRSKSRIRKLLCAITAMLTITMVSPVSRLAAAEDGGNGGISNTESQLQTILSENEEANVQVKNGLSIDVGQAIDHTSLLVEEEASIPFKLSSRDESIVKVDENGKFVGVATGETFITLESEGGTYVYQVLVKEPTQQVMAARTLTATTTKTITTNSNYRVFIDAGHGGDPRYGGDPGACANGLEERHLTLAIALKVQRILQSQGIEVVMSRTTDKFLELREISSLANNSGADAFASIHINSATTTAAYGIETYYYPNRMDSKPLADSVQKQLISSTGAYDRKVKTADFHVVRETKMPSILAECGFISNKSEAIKMSTNAYQELLASGISKGIVNYLEANVTISSTQGERMYGATRYETSYLVAKKGWTSSDTVVIAPGTDYPDALCAGPLAAKNKAPILLARNQSLNEQQELKNLLSNLKVKNVYIVGGTGVLSSTFENQIKAMNITTKRLGGANRYDTSVKIAQEVGTTGEVVISTGLNFADSLSISSVAGIKGMPILLTKNSEFPSSARNYLNSKNITKTYIVGGSGIISDALFNTFKNPERLGGTDRYATNEKILNRFKSSLNISQMYLALGTDFPDALSVSALASKNSSFVILHSNSEVKAPTMNIVTQNRDSINKIYVIGGPQLITSTALNKLRIKL